MNLRFQTGFGILRVSGLIVMVGCSTLPQKPAASPPLQGSSLREKEILTVIVPASESWTTTHLEVKAGESLHLEAQGSAAMVGLRLWESLFGYRFDRWVGPKGTYVWPRRQMDVSLDEGRGFPLPTIGQGPWPAYCLIGKIGETGEVFYVGERFDGIISHSGRLWLGVNDNVPSDNRGQFAVKIRFTDEHPEPVALPSVIEPHPHAGAPIAGARVLLLYIDGLRTDVLHEMAQAGFLPHLKQTFLDGGLECPYAFTVFPSNTLITNASLFTGLFPDRTGIKSQHQFERTTLKSKGLLSEWMPDWLFLRAHHTRVINLLDKYAPEDTHNFLKGYGVKTMGSRLGKRFRFTTLPIVPINPPPRWFHRAINTIGPFGITHRLPRRLDVVNAQYTIEELIGDPDARVIAVWFPMVDKICHETALGQFGPARHALALADRYWGEILKRLHEIGWAKQTYLILISDHGHIGGEPWSLLKAASQELPRDSSLSQEAPRSDGKKHRINQQANLAGDWACQQLGVNARVLGQEWMHPGMPPQRFFFFDNQGAGQAKLFIPFHSYIDGPWRRNRLFELTHYRTHAKEPSVDLIRSVAQFRPAGWNTQWPKPVDLVLVKLDEERVFVYRDDDCQAIIQRLEYHDGSKEHYRYIPVRHLRQTQNGHIDFEPAIPGVDPLGYLQDTEFLKAIGQSGWLDQAHTSEEWLQATHRTRYPDAVVAISKFFSWHGSLTALADSRDPDLMVTASEGWSFRSDDNQSTDHGYPLAESMRITLFLAGPHIPHGRLLVPQRIVNVMPTILDMIHWPYDPTEMDGQAIRGIYQEGVTSDK